MECEKLIKKENKMYMVDTNGYQLDLEDLKAVFKYEKENNLQLQDIINEFIISKDNNFKDIISIIEKMVEKYKVDYYVYGTGKEVSEDSVALCYNLKNRNSMIDCSLKVFYSEKYNSISYMIRFCGGSTGRYFGYDFYRYFKYDEFITINDMLEKYFTNDDAGINDMFIIDRCTSNIKDNMKNYYSV